MRIVTVVTDSIEKEFEHADFHIDGGALYVTGFILGNHQREPLSVFAQGSWRSVSVRDDMAGLVSMPPFKMGRDFPIISKCMTTAEVDAPEGAIRAEFYKLRQYLFEAQKNCKNLDPVMSLMLYGIVRATDEEINRDVSSWFNSIMARGGYKSEEEE